VSGAGGTVPRITVGIPFFDEEKYLSGAIRSVLAQTVTDLEVLLVDDGSTDRSLEIARSFDDPRVVVLSDGKRRHLPARLNEIALRARANLVARMDADDVAHPQRLARQVEVLEKDPSLDVVGTWAALVDDNGEVLAVCEVSPEPASARTALERGLIPHATMLARRSWLRANPYDEALTRAEDRDLWCRTVTTSRYGVVPSPLYVVRISDRDRSFVPGYLESQRQNRILMLRYGPGALGAARTARSWVASHLKGVAMRAVVFVGLTDLLVRRRGRPPTAEERALILEALHASEVQASDREVRINGSTG
jgi:glycosyltransferase involved in cell wall biosynthesis